MARPSGDRSAGISEFPLPTGEGNRGRRHNTTLTATVPYAGALSKIKHPSGPGASSPYQGEQNFGGSTAS